MYCLNSLDGLNKTTSLSDITLLSLVFGFLPILDFFLRMVKVPKLANLSFFSVLIFEIIETKKSSIRFSYSCLEKPNCI